MISFKFTHVARVYFFFNDTATTEIYTLSLHDALPISLDVARHRDVDEEQGPRAPSVHHRSEEHTSELQSQSNLVCRLLLEKKYSRLGSALIRQRHRRIELPSRVGVL